MYIRILKTFPIVRQVYVIPQAHWNFNDRAQVGLLPPF